jgi:hypothetical protein
MVFPSPCILPKEKGEKGQGADLRASCEIACPKICQYSPGETGVSLARFLKQLMQLDVKATM